MGFKDELTHLLEATKVYNKHLGELEEQVSNIKSLVDDIETNMIPALFHEYGFSDATMDDGTKVKLKQFISPKVLDENVFFKWLEARNLGSIIKDQIDLSKGQFDEKFKTFLEEGGYDYARKTSIHPQTLKATVSRLMEAGEELPGEAILTVSIFEKAEIKPKKE